MPPSDPTAPFDEIIAVAVMNERLRCAAIARQRAELWRHTPLASSELGPGREEARARANEATVIAELIESATAPPAVHDDPEVN